MRKYFGKLLNFQNPPAVGRNDLFPAEPEKVTTDILPYAQYLKDGIGIWNVVIGHRLRRQSWPSYPCIEQRP